MLLCTRNFSGGKMGSFGNSVFFLRRFSVKWVRLAIEKSRVSCGWVGECHAIFHVGSLVFGFGLLNGGSVGFRSGFVGKVREYDAVGEGWGWGSFRYTCVWPGSPIPESVGQLASCPYEGQAQEDFECGWESGPRGS